MKQFFIFILILCFEKSFSQKKVFALINEEKFEIVIDTIEFKKSLIDIVSASVENKPRFDKIEILKNKTFGEKSIEYFYLIATDKSQNLTVAKWLERKGNKLFIIDKLKKNNYHQVYYVTCQGTDNCLPEVGILDNSGHDLWLYFSSF